MGFVFLTDCAPTHIVFGEFFHSFAFVGLVEEVRRVRNSGVTRKWMIVVQAKDFVLLFEIFRELDLGKVHGWEQHHIFVVILPLADAKGSGQEVSGDVTLAWDVSKFKVKFC